MPTYSRTRITLTDRVLAYIADNPGVSARHLGRHLGYSAAQTAASLAVRGRLLRVRTGPPHAGRPTWRYYVTDAGG